MMKNIYFNQIFMGVLLFICTSCENFVEVDVPDSQLSGALVFEDVHTAEAVLTAVYTKMHNSVMVTGDANGISVLLGNYTDELTCYASSLPELLFYQNQLLATNGNIQTLWRNTYHVIYTLNRIIEGLENAETITSSDKARLTGEALFARAYMHFYLNQLFGEIPYVTSSDYRINTTIAKQNLVHVFLSLEDDLLRAENLLPSSYTGPHRVRPNKSTAMALLARLYLYNQQWELAKQKATDVIDNTGLYQWVTNVNDVFLRNSSGTIWQLMSGPEGKNTLEAKSFIFTLIPPPARALNENLVNAFDPDDLRKTNWIHTLSDGTQTFHHAFKYKLNNDTATSMEYPIQFRLEELYLIRAEANAQLNLIGLSALDLNKIRNRAGLEDTTAQSKEEILAAILQERQLEFFTELGHRFFDLKRFGLIDNILSEVKPGWNTFNALLPLPESELLLNPNLLPQNPGY